MRAFLFAVPLACVAWSGAALVFIQCGGSGSAGGVDSGLDGTATPDGGGSDALEGTPDGGATDALSSVDSAPSDAADASDAFDGAAEAADAADGGDASEGGIPCDGTHPCAAAFTCCSNFCVDTAHDPRNCGGCGTACSATQFCANANANLDGGGGDAGAAEGGPTCDDAVFANICANGAAVVALDPYAEDNEAGVSLGNALATSCSPPVGVRAVDQASGGILALSGLMPDGGRPNTGVGTTLIAGGGYYGQLAVKYMDHTGLTPVYETDDGTTAQYIERLTGSAVVTTPDSALTAQHDFFFVELAVEPTSGTLCFFGAGIHDQGTVAVGYWVPTTLIPTHAGDAHSWYVVEWTDSPADAGGDSIPNAGDTFRIVTMGP